MIIMYIYYNNIQKLINDKWKKIYYKVLSSTYYYYTEGREHHNSKLKILKILSYYNNIQIIDIFT